MAGFPPKSPRDHQKPPMSNGGRAAAMPTWVDEFLDFSSARRSLHRRSVSDSIAFFEVAPVPPPPVREENFDRLDDEQLMNMFSDDIPGISSSTTPSDHSEKASSGGGGGGNDEKPEVQSVCKQEENGGTPAGMGGDSNIDPKRVRRILANRQSAQRSRVRKLQYISELERSVSSLQAEVSILSPRVAFLDHQRLVLNVDNSALKQRIAVLAQDKMFKDAHQEALKKEIERLRMVYHQQSITKMNPTTDAHQPQDVELVN